MTRPELDIDALRNRLPLWPALTPAAGPGPALDELLAIFGADFHRTRTDTHYYCNRFHSAGYQLVVHQWRVAQPRGTVLILHGYFDHLPLYRRVIEALLSQGLSVVGFDLPGHGLSSGRRASIGSFADYQQILRDFIALLGADGGLPAPYYLVGQSTGGAIAMHYLLEQAQAGEPVFFSRTLLLAPLVRPTGWRLVFLAHTLLALFMRRIPRTFTPNSHDEGFLQLLRMEDPLQSDFVDVRWVGAMKRWARAFARLPVSDQAPLVIQGTLDFTVDWRYNLPLICRHFPAARIMKIEGAHHQLANESTEYLQPILAAMQEHFCPTPGRLV